mmetsp:Transcript_12194/g.29788  ORF Transcript_12194/g.29788 Transcript_12194/m.29788 type:complete len:130 (+) Transcript_12194:141-530(+)
MGQTQSISGPARVAQSGNDRQQQQQATTVAPRQQPPPIVDGGDKKNNNNIVAMVESRSNPHEADAASHNFGQPEKVDGASKLVTDCRIQQRESLACIEENYHNKNEACAAQFEAYKRCRREEHERRPAW